MSNKHAAELFTGVGVNAADVLFTTGSIQHHELFTLMSSAGAVEVLASVDGTNFSTVVLALEDQGATANSTYVVVTAPGRIYKFWGKYTRLRVRQNGATATAASLLCGAGA
jgi:Tfp pilus assembly major pilin PilA